MSELGSSHRVPTWGRVVARPHEFLIHMRRGQVVTSGHGATCFKWPSDSVALISTAIAKLSFAADQVTQEKIGVEVTGLAVYRVVDPLLSYRMVDVDTSRLGEILRDMFVGATRRIVAGLSLEACITHRKERVAEALMQEIAPVLSGSGELSDTSAQGWGVVIDTIEIQNVRVLSEEVFQRLQAPYRQSLALSALRAGEQVEEERARIELARRRAEEEGRRAVMQLEEQRLANERERALVARRHAEEIARVTAQAEIVRTDERDDAASRRAERATQLELTRKQALLEAELARRKAAFEAELEEKHALLEADRERAEADLAIRRAQGQLDAELLTASRVARSDLSERQLEELMLTETLPRMGEALRGTFGRVDLTSGVESGALFSFLSAGLKQVVRSTRELKQELSDPNTAES